MEFGGTYTIGIIGYTEGNFLIQYTSGVKPITRLFPGQPVNEYLRPDKESVYYFYIAENDNVRISMQILSGTAFMKANALPDDDEWENVYEVAPTRDGWATWNGEESSSRNEILISKDGWYWCINCEIVISIFSEQDAVSYIVTADYDSHPTSLQNGVPVRFWVQEGEWRQYTFNHQDNQDLYLSMTVYSGDTDLYVGFDSPLTQKNAIWKKDSTNQIEAITIKASEEHFKTGTYYIGVYGYKNSNYSITITTEKSYLTLLDGVPVFSQIGQGQLAKYQFWISEESRIAPRCWVIPETYNFYPKVYVKFQTESSSIRGQQEEQIPSEANNDMEFCRRNYSSYNGQLNIPLQQVSQVGNGKYNFVIQSDETAGSFTMQCSQSATSNAKILSNSSSLYDYVEKDEVRTYEILLPTRTNLIVEMQACSGTLQVQTTTNFSRSNLKWNMNDIVSTTETKKKMNISGAFYLKVQAASFSSDLSYAYYFIDYWTFTGPIYSRQFLPGNQGLISWDIFNNEVTLSWRPLEERGHPVVQGENSRVQYIVAVAVYKEKHVNLATSCGIQLADYFEQLVHKFNTTETTKTFKIKHKRSRKYIVNVVANFNDEAHLSSNIAYSPQIVQVAGGPLNGTNKWVIGVVIALLMMSLLVSFVLFRKMRKYQKRLNYEMTDVRNVAGITQDLDDQKVEILKQSYAPLTSEL